MAFSHRKGTVADFNESCSSNKNVSTFYKKDNRELNAFSVAAARVWNSLPADVTSSPSLPTFQRRLKTELFARSYS